MEYAKPAGEGLKTDPNGITTLMAYNTEGETLRENRHLGIVIPKDLQIVNVS